MGKVEHFGGFVNQHNAQRYQCIDGPHGDAVDGQLGKGQPKIIHGVFPLDLGKETSQGFRF